MPRAAPLTVSRDAQLWDAATVAPKLGLRNPKSVARFASRSRTLREGHRRVGRNHYWISDFVLRFIEFPDVAAPQKSTTP